MNSENLDSCENFGDIFELVKRSVEQTLGQRRGGLMLYLADLPPQIGALHEIGSNSIVINRVILNTVTNLASRKELNSYLYTILLHEYLHSLGVIDEKKVRWLTFKVAKETFGENHIAAKMALNPMAFFPNLINTNNTPLQGNFELIKDFDRSDQTYFI